MTSVGENAQKKKKTKGDGSDACTKAFRYWDCCQYQNLKHGIISDSLGCANRLQTETGITYHVSLVSRLSFVVALGSQVHLCSYCAGVDMMKVVVWL